MANAQSQSYIDSQPDDIQKQDSLNVAATIDAPERSITERQALIEAVQNSLNENSRDYLKRSRQASRQKRHEISA